MLRSSHRERTGQPSQIFTRLLIAFAGGRSLTLREQLSSMEDLTRILASVEVGESLATEKLLPVVYNELRKLAAKKLALEKPGQTLEATALVHEAYLRLIGNERVRHWDHRGHFFAAAAETMRRILVENARRKKGPKRGGASHRVDLDLELIVAKDIPEDLVALDEALQSLSKESPIRAELVKLRFFAGLTIPEAAEVLGISHATAERYWAYSRAWLYAELDSPREP